MADSPNINAASIGGMDARRLKTRHELLNQGVLRFQDVFWGKGDDPTEGVRVVHEVFCRHLAEAEDLIALVRVRVAIEELNASKLGELGRLSGIPGSAANEVHNILMGGSSLGGNSPSSAGPVTLGVGRRGGPGSGGSNFISTGNGITSIGNQPVTSSSGNLFNTFTALAMSVATNITNITTSSPSIDRSGHNSGNTPSSPMTGGLGSGNISSGVNANAFGSLQSASGDQREGVGAPLATDFANFSSSGANGFTEDASSLLPVIRTLREQMMAMAAVHRRHADNLTLNVLSPLTAFVDQNRRMLNKKKADVDAAFNQFMRIATDIEGRRHQYFAKTKAADDEDEKFKRDGEARANPPKLGPILFGSRSIPLQEFHDIVNFLKRDIKTKGILTPVGLFDGCFLGEDALALLQMRYAKSPRADIRDLCQEFVSRRCISPVVGGADGKFSASLPYTFGRPVLKTGEAPHIKSRKDAEIAKLEYEASIGSSENARTTLEQCITEYLIVAQEAETFRLTIARGALQALESAQVFVINEFGNSWLPRASGSDNSGEDVDGPHIAERYRTGHLRIPPVIFESYEDGHIASQTFGVSLEDLAEVHEVILPIVIQKCVGALADAFRQGRPQASMDSWLSMSLDYQAIQFLRQEMNKLDPEAIRNTNMKRYQSATIANVLRMYLVELPVSVCSYELYDPLKVLYSEGENEATRLKSIKSLLKTLVPAHFETLRVLAAYFSEIAQNVDPSEKLFRRFCWSIAPLILRPQTETRDNLGDEHPYLFIEDLLLKSSMLLDGKVDLEEVQEVAVVEELPLDDPVMKERRKVKKARVTAAESPKSVSSNDQPPSKRAVSSSHPKTPTTNAEKIEEFDSLPYPTLEETSRGRADAATPKQSTEIVPPEKPNPAIDYNAAAVIDTILASSVNQPPPQTKNANWMPWSAKYTQASDDAEGEGEELESGEEPVAVEPTASDAKEEETNDLEGDEFTILDDSITLASIPSLISNAVDSAAKALTSDSSPLTPAGAAAMGNAITSVADSMMRETKRVVQKVVARHAETVAANKEMKTRLTSSDDDVADYEVPTKDDVVEATVAEVTTDSPFNIGSVVADPIPVPEAATDVVKASDEGEQVALTEQAITNNSRGTSLDVDATSVWAKK
ncbi:hypothetical protein BC829DRAFT_378829 [Chytridium lagenaria]|nr:hypothetical protein BC829DRAFT_378829 [Chytridium lagenaria]